MILYPFVEGHNGYALDLSARHWHDFGVALKRIHSAKVPPALIRRIQPETYAPLWRESVKSFLARVEYATFADPVAIQLAAFLQAKRAELLDLVGRAERFAQILQARSPDYIVCHSE